MSFLENFASRFTTADLTYFLVDINQHLVPPFVLTCSRDALRYMSRGSALCPFSLNTLLIPLIIFMGRSWLLIHHQHTPDHISIIPLRLIWYRVSSIHPELLWMGYTWYRAGESPTWIWTLTLMISGHKEPFIRPWCCPPPNRIWVLTWSIWDPCTLLLGKHFVCHMPICPVHSVL